MNWRAWARRLLPYAIAATGGFLIAYLVVAFLIFPAGIVPEDETVPDVVGLSFSEAEERLVKAGFRAVQGDARFNVAAPRWTVLEQRPPAGAREQPGARVTLTVSGGHQYVVVPMVTGMTRAEAERALAATRLDLGEVVERPSELPRGQVLETSPAAGVRVPVPSAVQLVVSAGPSAVAVPDLIGRPYEQARIILEQLGLRVGVVTADPFSTAPSHTVVAQAPASGESVSAGSGVALTVAGSAPEATP